MINYTITTEFAPMPRRRSRRPQTDDMRVMCDDIGNVEPLPVELLDSVLQMYSARIADELDRQFFAALHYAPMMRR